jgi:hypothetical protein
MIDNPTSCDKITYPTLMCFHPKNNVIYKISIFYSIKLKNKVVDLLFKCHQQQTTHKQSSLLHVDSCLFIPTRFRHPFVSNEILNGLSK